MVDQVTKDAAASGLVITIDVQYRNIDGYHVFTSDDVNGLYIASKDGQKAYDNVAQALEVLIEKNEGIKGCKIDPAEPYKSWLESRRLSEPVDFAEIPHPVVFGNKQFVLRCD